LYYGFRFNFIIIKNDQGANITHYTELRKSEEEKNLVRYQNSIFMG